tara:strand:+ start:1037 stop:2176 length:1140 start_codon:yes stop_codon:yes gene_type:complete
MLKNKLFIGITVLICSAGLFATGVNWEDDNKKESFSSISLIKDEKKSSGLVELPFTNDEKNNTAIFEKASPSVVFVTNTKLRRQRFSLNVSEIPQGTGTGFIWDRSGIIVTNFHVVYRANKITITTHSNRSYEAKIIGAAPEKDIALLKIDTIEELLEPLPLGDSSALAVGRKVLAIGNPFGLDSTLTVGVVSALGREIKSLNQRTIRDVIQTDAAINPGNSGGPLLNSSGQIIGVNTAIRSPSGASAGIGFAIPINTLKNIVPQLIEHGKVVRPVMGVELLSDYWTKRLGARGVAIFSVIEGLPAERAGMVGVRYDKQGKIHLGDVLIDINGALVSDEDTLLEQLEKFEPGDKIEVTTTRNEKIKRYQLTLDAPNPGN